MCPAVRAVIAFLRRSSAITLNYDSARYVPTCQPRQSAHHAMNPSFSDVRGHATPHLPQSQLHLVPVLAPALRPFDLCRSYTCLYRNSLFRCPRLFTRFLYKPSAVASSIMHTSLQFCKKTQPQIHHGIANDFFILHESHDDQHVALQHSFLSRPAIRPLTFHHHLSPTLLSPEDRFDSKERGTTHALTRVTFSTLGTIA